MPASKKTATKKKGNNAAKKPSSKKSTNRASAKAPTPPAPAPANTAAETPSAARILLLHSIPPILILLALLLLICLLSPTHMGLLGDAMKTGMTGLLGGAGYLIPIFLTIIALLFRKDAEKKTVGLKFIYAPVICLLTATLLQLWANPGNPHTFDVGLMWQNGIKLIGGGVLGGLFGEAIHIVFGSWGTPIIAIAGILLLTLLLFNLTPYTIYVTLAGRFRAQREELARKERRASASAHAPTRQKRYAVRKLEPTGVTPGRHLRAVREPSLPETGRHAIKLPIDIPDPQAPAAEPNRGRGRQAEMPSEKAPDRKVFADDPSSESSKPQPETERILTDDIPVSIYGKPTEQPPSAASDSDVPSEEDEIDDTTPPWDDSPSDRATGQEETLTPLRIRKKDAAWDAESPADTATEAATDTATDPNNRAADEAPSDLPPESVISDDVMESFRASRQTRPEGGEVGESGQILQDDADTDNPDEEFALAIKRLSAMEGVLPAENRISPKEEEPVIPYELPPITLLNPGEDNREKDVSEELNTNATRLVDTLRSFRVRTRLVAISRGPAITRYELAPEEGVKVRSIANLVDDIALNLATTGVRIEAPIPGKSAVGVEVPNQKVELVALRDLIDTAKFREASSLIMVALGMDVAGAPIYLDIAKMPHLLIAGTTGSGKSVSINCMLVSLLYHAAPDQVKLILIDPKKVELNIYNGLPHLLVPVVSDPKKAAGALHWAVTEMERRFEMIEAAGVRDLKHYNAQIENDPSAEFLPQIVIVIDELADLMMTSRDEVETSICRLAQKARAAGMHLIIGTQRPSVDVVTGVIKANIPSRIAFKVAGQTDSRVILDNVGAEKLLGNGDMLYAPVSCSKPIRVQGAFVSSEEVDEIVSFIKNQSRASYDASVIHSIDEAAERCGSGKRGAEESGSAHGGGEDPGEHDPMLKKAVALAVESGKISTSLIQRRLSLGYGRAAKLIDRMETMGIVGPPDGQKPRNVLITTEQYTEMIAGGFDESLR